MTFRNYQLADVDFNDYPDFVDAYICYADAVLDDGAMRPATKQELDILSKDDKLVSSLLKKLIKGEDYE